MHSSVLRACDFHLLWKGGAVSHEGFFRDHDCNTRVGLLAPEGTEGVGAVTLAMACVTAFYDRFREDYDRFREGDDRYREGDDPYREDTSPFFAYPDFFTFQRRDPVASYGSFDFWPNKDVRVPEDRNATVAAIADRGVNVLLVPDACIAERVYEPVQLERARRTLLRCFAYDACGEVENPDLTIRCSAQPLLGYATQVVRSANAEMPEWMTRLEASSTLRQSFRELDLDDALARL